MEAVITLADIRAGKLQVPVSTAVQGFFHRKKQFQEEKWASGLGEMKSHCNQFWNTAQYKSARHLCWASFPTSAWPLAGLQQDCEFCSAVLPTWTQRSNTGLQPANWEHTQDRLFLSKRAAGGMPTFQHTGAKTRTSSRAETCSCLCCIKENCWLN